MREDPSRLNLRCIPETLGLASPQGSKTALHLAAEAGQLEAVALLLTGTVVGAASWQEK